MNTKPSEFDAFTNQLSEDVAESLHFIPVREDKAADVPKEEDLKKEKYWLSLEEARERLKSGKNVGPVLRDQLSIFVVMNLEEAGLRVYCQRRSAGQRSGVAELRRGRARQVKGGSPDDYNES